MERKTSIWITGSSRGLGLEIAKRAAKENFEVFFGSRKKKEYYLNEGYFTESFVSLPNVHYRKCNVTNQDSVRIAYAKIMRHTPQVDILINNAGIIENSPVETMSEAHIKRIIKTNLYGSLFPAQIVLPNMRANKRGAIINITSVAAEKAFPNTGAYAAAKAGAAALFRSLREEVREDNIKVVNLAPGAINSEIWDEKIREKFGEKMMTCKSLAEAIFSTAKLSLVRDMNIEEMTIRPQGGDL